LASLRRISLGAKLNLRKGGRRAQISAKSMVRMSYRARPPGPGNDPGGGHRSPLFIFCSRSLVFLQTPSGRLLRPFRQGIVRPIDQLNADVPRVSFEGSFS